MRINLTARLVKGPCAPSIGERLKSGTLSKSDGIRERGRRGDALKYQEIDAVPTIARELRPLHPR